MSLRDAIRFFSEKLAQDTLGSEERRAFHFAKMALVCLDEGSAPNPAVPYWRYVEYTDDGCSRYQCLNCKEIWEGRDSPGYVDGYEECNEAEAISGYTRDGIKHWYKYRDEPVYHPDQRYCGYCGITWEGPIRREPDNQRMLGERRLRIQRAMETYTAPRSTSFWVVERRGRPDWPWCHLKCMDPARFNAVEAKQMMDSLKRDDEELRLRLVPRDEVTWVQEIWRKP